MKKCFQILIALIFLNSFSNCSSFHPKNDNQLYLRQGHYQLYSYPELDKENLGENSKIHRIVIASTNDLHGNLEPIFETTPETIKEKSMSFPIGGSAMLASYVKVLREKYPQEVLLLDAGDLMQGTLISNNFKGKPVIEVYNKIGYDAITIGNHEFDYGPTDLSRIIPLETEDPQGALKERAQQSLAPFVSSNIIELATGRPIAWPNFKRNYIKEINGVKVGIIGITTTETPSTAISQNIKGLYFEDIATSLIKNAKLVRSQGADIVIAMAHTGAKCGYHFAKKNNYDMEKLNFDPQDISLCHGEGDELLQATKKIPQGTIDALVTGHTHSKIANYFHGIPTIQAFSKGQYLARMELYYDAETKKLLKEKTIIHQPTKICHSFFKESEDCFTKDPTINHQETIPATFLGEKVTPDPDIASILAPYQKEIKRQAERHIIDLKYDLPRTLANSSMPLGSFVADSMKEALNTDFAAMNSGGVRKDLEAGTILFKDAFRVCPFQNNLVKVMITGKQLKMLFRIGSSDHEAGPLIPSGLKLVIAENQDTSISEDLNQDGKKEKWERNRLLRLTTTSGEEIQDDKTYSLATVDFMAIAGGDHYGYVFNQIDDKNKVVNYEMTYRDAFIQKLQKTNNYEIKRYLKDKRFLLTDK